MSRRRAAERAAYMPAKPAPMMTSLMCLLLGLGFQKSARHPAALHRGQRSTTTRRRETKASARYGAKHPGGDGADMGEFSGQPWRRTMGRAEPRPQSW